MKKSVGRVAGEERDLRTMLDSMDAPMDAAAEAAGFERLMAAMAEDERRRRRWTRMLTRVFGLL
jgi:hypothetical protein